MSGPSPAAVGVPVEELAKPEKMDKSLQKENKKLRGEIKTMEMKIKTMQVELGKSTQMKDKLEALCRELQKQNKYIKAESSAKIKEANARGKELASEVQNNMGFMKSINENLAAISSESLTVKRENDELAKKIAVLKGHYEERESILQSALKETNESLAKAKLELGETQLLSAQEKEKLILEMQKLADALLQSREQMREAKQTELGLREMIASYESKFAGLQQALKDTNGSYEEFRSEMNKVSSRTKGLEKETLKWQQRWEESSNALTKMRANYTKVSDELGKSVENLEKMKALCRQLHGENRELQAELEGKSGAKKEDPKQGLSAAAEETLTVISNEAKEREDAKKSENSPQKVENGPQKPETEVKPEAVAVEAKSEEIKTEQGSKSGSESDGNVSSPSKKKGKGKNQNSAPKTVAKPEEKVAEVVKPLEVVAVEEKAKLEVVAVAEKPEVVAEKSKEHPVVAASEVMEKAKPEVVPDTKKPEPVVPEEAKKPEIVTEAPKEQPVVAASSEVKQKPQTEIVPGKPEVVPEETKKPEPAKEQPAVAASSEDAHDEGSSPEGPKSKKNRRKKNKK